MNLLLQVELHPHETKRKPIMSRLSQQRHYYLTCELCYRLDHVALQHIRLTSPYTTTDNHVGNQASQYHPRTTEGDRGVYSHHRFPNGYQHHRHTTITITCLNEDEVWRTDINTQLIGVYSPNRMLQAYILERGLFNPVSHRTLRWHHLKRQDDNWSSPSQGKTRSQSKWLCTLRNCQYIMQEFHYVSCQWDLIKETRGPRHVLY